MREECRHFQSRTYVSGDAARFCELDLAPEAPWRCPADCPRYERRLADAGWVHGTLVEPPLGAEPAGGGDSGRLLDAAEDIVNAVVPDALLEAARIQSEQERQRRRQRQRRRWPWRRR